MKLEHIALNVLQPVEMADWYATHLKLRIVKTEHESPYTRFLSDDGGSLFEIYNNPRAEIPDYAALHPLNFHLAFAVDDIDSVRDQLIAAGCTPEGDPYTVPPGDRLAFLRDPWAVPIQLATRQTPFHERRL
jgi:catechol 2,3-dioxygenase-like lactoylglutathione lyase family enzyme